LFSNLLVSVEKTLQATSIIFGKRKAYSHHRIGTASTKVSAKDPPEAEKNIDEYILELCSLPVSGYKKQWLHKKRMTQLTRSSSPSRH
jgi:hypothetical protein